MVHFSINDHLFKILIGLDFDHCPSSVKFPLTPYCVFLRPFSCVTFVTGHVSLTILASTFCRICFFSLFCGSFFVISCIISRRNHSGQVPLLFRLVIAKISARTNFHKCGPLIKCLLCLGRLEMACRGVWHCFGGMLNGVFVIKTVRRT